VKVLVTGGAGFIGSHVVDRLLAAGHEPRIFDVRRSPYPEHARVDTVVGDIRKGEEVLAAAEGCDVIAHLAASADVGVVAKHPCDAEELNARGTLHVLEAARATGARVLYASTIWAYSDVKADEVDEDTDIALPSHLYTATKVAGEMYCKSYGELYGVESTILRFGIPYGPRARPAAVLPIFVNKALAGEPLTIAGDGSQTRRFVYVEDLADGVVAALRPVAAGRVYNLVGEEDTSVKQIAAAVRDAIGDVEIVHTEGRNGDFAGARVSGARAASELGWTAATPFADGVRSYVAWHEHEARAGQVPVPAARKLASWPARVLRSWAVVPLVFLVVAAYLGAIESVGLSDRQAGTVGIVTAIALLCTVASQRLVAARYAWSVGVLALLPLLAPDMTSDVHLARLDSPLLLLGAAGAGLALALIDGGRRLAGVPAPSRDTA
jgi:UDP-glucose 4-epimerase